jgi:hypothetical protein
MTINQTSLQTAWLLMNDKDFLRQNAGVNARVFQRGPVRYLVRLAIRQWEAYHTTLTKAVVDMAISREGDKLIADGATEKDARNVFDDLNVLYGLSQAELPAARGLCRSWLEENQLRLAITDADVALKRNDQGRAEQALQGARLPSFAQSTNLSINPGSAPPLTVAAVKPGAFPTGLYDLDAAWDGGYRKGELGMIVAPTGIGKSMGLCLLAAEAFWRGAKVLYYTYELTPEQIRDRIITAILQKKPSQINKAWDDELLLAAKGRGVPVPTTFDIDIRNSSMTWPAVAADLDEYKAVNGQYPDVLLLDSADDIAPLRGRDANHTELKEAFVYLRSEIAEGRQIRVWTSGQLNRESIDKARISLKYIGDAFAKVQKSHYCIGFAQTEQDLDDVDGPQLRIYVLKDSLHGTRGAFLKGTAEWGRGKDGYPGITVKKVEGL